MPNYLHPISTPRGAQMEAKMTAYDHFQISTCQIAEGDRKGAMRSLDAAIRDIDETGEDAFLRNDIVTLRKTVAANVAADYRASAAYWRKKASDLDAQYQGVRPSWVSGDIGWNLIEAERYDRLAEDAERDAA